MKSLPILAAGLWADIWIKDLIQRYLRPVTVPPLKMWDAVWPVAERDPCRQNRIPPLITVSFNSVGWDKLPQCAAPG
ncbi:hypothetical protein TNCV_3360561 [Trichonephila clavipes]|nr:hypothetical protein TNCV_3360561 [Trichonephila clavipes]